MLTLTILAIGLILTGLMYGISTLLYAKKIDWYMKIIFPKLHPKLARDEMTWKNKLYMLIAVTAAMFLISAGLIFAPAMGMWFGLIPIVITLGTSINEIYRGVVYYPSVDDWGEAKKHMVIHSLLTAWILAFLYFSWFPAAGAVTEGFLHKLILSIF